MPQPTLKQYFLMQYEKEHATTMKLLRAYPVEHVDLRPHPRSKSALELAWVFVLERGLGEMLMQDAFAAGVPAGEAPAAPAKYEDVLSALEAAHQRFAEVVRGISDEQLLEEVSFFTAPQTMGRYTRLDAAWFLLFDQIHHRGQFSVYLRMAGARVPSIYGPTADEPWM